MQAFWWLGYVVVFCLLGLQLCDGQRSPLNLPGPHYLQPRKSRQSWGSAFEPTTKVRPQSLGNNTCISSKTVPIILTRGVVCPCFISYTIGSDQPTTWDIFVISSSSLTTWQSLNYSGNPPDIMSAYSQFKQTTNDTRPYIRSEKMNAFVSGVFHLAIRTNTASRRCFNSASGTAPETSIVFEAMPAACKIVSEEPTPRIVGGVPVNNTNSADLFRWMALIWQINGRPVCGGSLIAPGYVLTAAHCYIHVNVAAYSVRIGSLQAEEGKSYGISRAFTHPRFYQLASNEAVNDITILELMDADDRTDTIAYNTNDSIPAAGEIVTTAGFGHISEDWTALPTPNRLLRVDVPVVSRAKCKERFENLEAAVHICAGYSEGGCDSCQSDSGGPLRHVRRTSDGQLEQVLVGIVSFGSGCARSENPGVYTRVSGFRQWINETLVEAEGTRRGGFLSNRAAVGGVVGGGVIVVVAIVVVTVVVVVRRRAALRRNESGGGDGSSFPSTCGVSA